MKQPYARGRGDMPLPITTEASPKATGHIHRSDIDKVLSDIESWQQRVSDPGSRIYGEINCDWLVFLTENVATFGPNGALWQDDQRVIFAGVWAWGTFSVHSAWQLGDVLMVTKPSENETRLEVAIYSFLKLFNTTSRS